MARRTSKFVVIWIVVILLSLFSLTKDSLDEFGYESYELLFEDLFSVTVRAGIVLVPMVVLYTLFRKLKNQSEKRSSSTGRVTRCYKCRRTIEESTGSRCQFCQWIRCRCGACGCGRGKLV